MKLLHIANDYFGSKIYQYFFNELDKSGHDQTILIFHRKWQITSVLSFLKNTSIKEHTVNLSLPVLFLGRVFPFFRNLILLRYYNKMKLGPFQFVHAHTLISNGSFALALKKWKNIPYIVTVRNSDINMILKYFRHLTRLSAKVLSNAEMIIFLNPAYKNKLLEVSGYNSETRQIIESRSAILPNGVEDFWINNVYSGKSIKSDSEINILYVGEITVNKNIDYLLNVFERLKGRKFKLWIIGRTWNIPKNIEHLKHIENRLSLLTNAAYLGEISDRGKLIDYYRRSHIFFMASKSETFGLVYIEAMTQGTPIVYTRGEGIDGYFEPGQVGFPVDINLVDSAESAIYSILGNYNEMSSRCIEKSIEFSWKVISDRYNYYLRQLKFN